MHHAYEIVPAGAWPQAEAADRISLAYNERHRRRFRYCAEGGTVFLLDLPRAAVLNHGDGIRLDDDRIVAVIAAAEALTEVRAASVGELLRLAWHIGNRHLAAQLDADRILIREDHVITDMLLGLGAQVRHLQAPFTPESGAYANAHGHGQGHGGEREHTYVFLADHAH